jgi:hypothetical protein
LSSWEVLGYFRINWMHELLRWYLLFSNSSVKLFDMQQLRGKLLLWECGECMHSMPVGAVVTCRI